MNASAGKGLSLRQDCDRITNTLVPRFETEWLPRILRLRCSPLGA